MKGKKIFQYLKNNHVDYEVISHPTAYSAQMIAHSAHIHGKELAKSVIVKVNGKMVMVVTTANQKVNMRLLKSMYGTDNVELAAEGDFMNIFSDCELGAMPPFGVLYGMEELVSEDLAKDAEIAFNAGTHRDLIKMRYNDFAKLVKPIVINLRSR